MKKRNAINLLLAMLLFIVSVQFSFGQTMDKNEYARIKKEFYEKLQQYQVNPSIFNMPVDPGANYVQGADGRLTYSPNSVNNTRDYSMNPPFINKGFNETDALANGYTFSSFAGTYNPITGGTVAASGAGIDDNTYPTLPIGFTFNFNGQPYTTFGIDANGYIWFGNVTPLAGDRATVCASTTASDAFLIAMCYDLLSNPNSELRYQTQGSSPNRTLTVQWKNWSTYNLNVAEDTLNFQVILYETGDSVNFSYGTQQKIATVRNPQIGLRGFNNTDWTNRINTTDWVTTSAGSSNTSVMTFSNTNLPASGQTYSYKGVPVSYLSSNTLQLQSGVPVYQGFTNQQMIQIQVNAAGQTTPLPVTNFNLGTNGSTSPATDIVNAKLYYTGTSAAFATTNLYGTMVSPNGTFSISGTQNIIPGVTNYFWLTYDVSPTATAGNVLDAQCNSITMGGVQVPSTVAPAGNRPIVAVPPPFCGTKNIPGDYPSLAACFADLNLVGVLCPTTINVAAGYTETASNLVLTCSTNPPNATNTLTFRKNGAGVNPLITAGTGVSTTLDGMIILNGVKYVTFDGIDLQENVLNTDATMQMEWGYALLKQSGTLASQNNTIKNCTITLNKNNVNSTGIYTGNHLTTSTTALSVTSLLGTGSYNKFYNNTVQNCFIPIQIQGFSAASPFDLYDQGNEVGTIAGGRSQVLNFGNGTSTSSAYGIRTINQNGLKIFNTNINSTGGANNNSTLNGIFLSTASNGSCEIYGDTVTVVSGATTSQLIGINCDMGATGLGNTISIHDNVVKDCLYPASTSGEFRGITTNTNSSASYINLYNNKVINNSIPGTGQYAGMFVGAGNTTNSLQLNVYGNEVSGNTKTGTAGTFYMLHASASVQNIHIYNNNVFNNSCATSSGTAFGIYTFATPFFENVHDNQVYNNTAGTGDYVCMQVAGGSGPTNREVYNNTISGNTGSALVGGILINFGTTSNVYRNNIFNQTSNNVTLSPAVYGIQLGASTSLNTSIYNNFISELKTPLSTSLNAIYGIHILGVAGANNIYAYYNTIYLNAVSSSATSFGTAGLFYANTTATANLDMRNNVIVNVSNPGPTSGTTKAFQRATTTLTNFNLVSGNNCFYAGTPGPTRLIHTDGTNLDQTLQAYKDRVSPREQASFTELPPFVNIATSPYDLHVQTGTGTQVEKGGQPVSVTVDYDGTTRNATFPDAGADEMAGTMTDNASPLITYTLLGNSDATSPRSVGNISITDPSGINVTAGTKPRIYYKKSTNTNTFNDNTNATDGWKFVEATNAASPFSFNVDYTLINGGIAAGNTVQYFVVAQDLNGTPRIGLNSGAFTTQPASVNLAAANFPLLGTINQYTITSSAGLSGTLLVGSTETVTSLTNAGGAFALINAGGLSGNLTISITSDLNSELGTNALNQWSEFGVGGYTVTIQPSAGTIRTIQGITNSNGMVRLDGADRVTIDGRFGGTGQFLRFRNFSTSGPGILMLNDAQNNTVRNCILEGNSTSTAGNTAGVINIGTTTGLNGNDNNVITFNDIRDRSDSTKFPVMGIMSTGTSTTIPQYNNNCTISNNSIHDFYLDGSTVIAGLNISVGTSNWNIDSNSFYQTVPRVITLSGTVISAINLSNSALVATNGGFNIRRNFIGGSAPLCGGTPWTQSIIAGTGTDQFRGMSVITGQIPNFIQNNTIANMDWTTNSPSANTVLWSGIGTGNGIHNITGNTVGSGTGNDNIKMTLNGTGPSFAFIRAFCLASFTSTVHGGIIDNNTVGSITIGGTTTSALGALFEGCSIQGSNGVVTNVSISNNTIGSLTTPNSIRTTYSPAVASQLLFVRCLTPSGVTVTMDNNKIMNVSDTTTSASTSNLIVGVLTSAVSNATPVITNNIISNIKTGTTSAFLNDLTGVQYNGNSPNVVISGNTINNMQLTNTAAASHGTSGIVIFNNSSGGSISKNKISGQSSQSVGGSAGIWGVYFVAGGVWNVNNNMISITNGEATQLDARTISENTRLYEMTHDNSIKSVVPGYESTSINQSVDADMKFEVSLQDATNEKIANTEASKNQNQLNNRVKKESGKDNLKSGELSNVFTNNVTAYGISDNSSATSMNVLYNTIYIGGTSVSSNSYCYFRSTNSILTLSNNLFYNNRVSSGFNYAVSNQSTTPAANWVSSSSNYNVFVTQDSNFVGEWGVGVSQNINQWRTSSSGDKQTWYAKASEISPSALFTSIPAGDLHINSGNTNAWLVSGKGIALSTLGTDFDGNTRSTSIANGVTDIGADEFTATPPSSPNALQSGAPSSGGTTDYTLYGRKICTINWGTGGTYPTSMNVTYNSGVSPVAPNVSTPNRTSASYWTATPVGTFSGTTYDITWYYGDNETFTITNPSTNILLGKNDNTFWMTYPQGSANLMSEFTPSANSVKVRGLFRFSSFTLGDASLPAEFPRTPLNNSTVNLSSATLVWSKSALATSYRVQLATDSLFNTIVVNDSTVTDTTKLVTGLVNGQNYWWRVNGKISLGNVGGWSQVFKFTCNTVLPPALVNLKVIPGGFYNTGTGRLNMRDTVRAILVDSATCTRVDSSRIVIDSVSFTGQLSFANAPTGNYYLFIFHRNHIPVAARLKQTITRGSTVSYDFTTDSAKTYGFNAIKLAVGVWGMMPGDANQDQFVDGLDQTIWLLQNGLDGFLSADFNGDRFVDGLDQTLWLLYNGNSSFLPCNITEMDPVALEKFLQHQAQKLIDNQKAYEIIQEAIKNKNINRNNNTVPNGDVKNPVNNNGSETKNSNTNKKNK